MPNNLFAISDIHLANPENLAYFSTLPDHKDKFPPNSGLILAGDVGESIVHLRQALEISLKVFKYIWWVPGNHELYTVPKRISSDSEEDEQTLKDAATDGLKGEERYLAFIVECHKYPNVFTPEDDYQIWDCNAPDPLVPLSTISASLSPNHTIGGTSQALICPLFTLYDYTFRPPHITTVTAAKSWAEEAGIVATDEALLHSDPYPSKESWCTALLAKSRQKLTTARQAHPDIPLVLINHWPLSRQVLDIPAIPRFSIWCGSIHTESWTEEFKPVGVVVSGHLHVRRTDWIGETRWEEVSLGYPRQWVKIKDEGIECWEVCREILPGPGEEKEKGMGTRWRRLGGW